MFTVYSKPACPQCDQAKALLKHHGLAYNEVILDVGQEKIVDVTYIDRAALLEKFPSARTMPQITNGDAYVGGVSELRKVLSA